ncbi:MAG: hypothetical protein QGG53_06360 [Planctomycetota bacterium]|jgi:hypothetical protein|nr:hypothetical protein [Planctomycetota bacterium]MDP7398199.1 hypothetical protein [Lentisphaeria bacterium]|tara:strand:+ start:240 stop:437 length:198 start_codon:yes stop_codon:yes gene_type:complete
MGDGAAIVGALIFPVVPVVIGTLVGAIILRAAISLYNKRAGMLPAFLPTTFGRGIIVIIHVIALR